MSTYKLKEINSAPFFTKYIASFVTILDNYNCAALQDAVIISDQNFGDKQQLYFGYLDQSVNDVCWYTDLNR